MLPKVQSILGQLKLRYHLAHSINCAIVYPLLSPNGSSIIICGHESGLVILWRGGRPLKKLSEEHVLTKDGSGVDTVMVIDSDDDEQQSKSRSNLALFEEREEEVDPSAPYQPIVQHLDLTIGCSVLHLAFPPLTASQPRADGGYSAAILQNKMLVALACGDSTIRILTIPLTPPSSEAKHNLLGSVAMSRNLLVIPSHIGHKTPPKAISIAVSPRLETEKDSENEEDSASDSDSQDSWDLIVASYSADFSGHLLVHKLRLSLHGLRIETPLQDDVLWRSQILGSPAAAVRLNVPGPSVGSRYPRVLVAQESGLVRIYECCTTERPDHGSWSISLYPSLSSPAENTSSLKVILDAQWILNGKGIAVLTVNGEWGIWDLYANKSGKPISGGWPTKYTLSGWVGGPSTLVFGKGSGTSQAKPSLAPMTPNMRKIKQDALFGGTPLRGNTSTCGGIFISPSRRSSNGKADDEAVLMWYGDKMIYIPSLRSHWQARVKGSTHIYGEEASIQTRQVVHVEISEDEPKSAALFPTDDAGLIVSAKPADILVSSGRSFTILTRPMKEPALPPKASAAARPLAVDQDLLMAGALDVDGMDRILDGMSHRSPVPMSKHSKKVGRGTQIS